MDQSRRKRKGNEVHSDLLRILMNQRISPFCTIGSHRSLEEYSNKKKKKLKEQIETQIDEGTRVTAIVTAPPLGNSAINSHGRGLKRKIGCIECTLRIGRKKKLEREFILGQEIGKGKFGSVRVCHSKNSGTQFACKSLPKFGDESFHREVEIMQHLSGHPNVVTLKAVYEDCENFYLVMELCSGGRLLDQMVKEGRYTERRAANLIREVIMVIKYCHDMGVVHRDVKPENILLTSSGKVKLADFGLAVRISNGQTLTGVAGSPAYVAPEVLTGSYSEKVDIWAVGVLMHALLIGVLPFQGESLEAVFEAIKTVKLDFHNGVWQSISGLARDLLSKMLTRDVSKRIAADEVLKHPWIVFYTERSVKALSVEVGTFRCNKRNSHQMTTADGSADPDDSGSYNLLSSNNSSLRSEDQECGLVDALAAAISRVRISEPKRTRICGSIGPIQQQCSSNMKVNLCAAF